MHVQKGMTSFKQDLQKKIQNYQSILKKTYEQPSASSGDMKQGRIFVGGTR